MGVLGEKDKNSKRSFESFVSKSKNAIAVNQETQIKTSLRDCTFITPNIKINL